MLRVAIRKDEGCSHEQAVLIEGKDGPLIVYVMEVEDVDRSKRAAVESKHPIDVQHQRVMRTAVGEAVPSEVLLDLRPLTRSDPIASGPDCICPGDAWPLR